MSIDVKQIMAERQNEFSENNSRDGIKFWLSFIKSDIDNFFKYMDNHSAEESKAEFERIRHLANANFEMAKHDLW